MLNKRRFLFIFSIILLISLFNVISGIEEIEMKKEIKLSDLTLREKIGQLIIVKPKSLDKRYFEDLHVGGIFLNNLKTREDYQNTIKFYQDNSKLPLLVATDMEGYWNPFPFYKSKSFGQINNKEEAYLLGEGHGKILNELGFNLDFSPIVEVRNTVWPGRSFKGSEQEVKEKISGYIQGLKKQKILSTAKHYPGGSMVKNPHLFRYKTQIYPEDLEYFDYAIKQKVDAIMVGHPIVYGTINSNGKQVTISKEIIFPLKEKFDGLIITDAVTMLGLRISYLFNFKKVYPDLILAGNDIILDVHIHSGYNRLKKRIDELENAVKEGKISEHRIDESVRKILAVKGYNVI